MKKVEFRTLYEDQVQVNVDGDKYGTLKFDHDQNAWVLWPLSIDDGVSYSDNLEDTEADITDEIQSYNED